MAIIGRTAVCLLLTLVLLCASTRPGAALDVPSHKAAQAPVLDGSDADAAWQGVKPLAIRDGASGTMILLRSVYTADQVYFLVQFADPANNILHKPWVWNAAEKKYESGPHREDTFVFKWNMMNKDVDLSAFSDDDYLSDIWYFKGNRTNPSGYADDQTQTLSATPGKKSDELVSKTGKKRYLSRPADPGKAAYVDYKPSAYEGDLVDAFKPATPDGSRADVRAKGYWNKGLWFIEFGRKLNTGYDDDVQFNPAVGKPYLFGVSIFSLYGQPLDAGSPNLYGMGRISEPLYLQFK